jgi:ankyrin repeat protein
LVGHLFTKVCLVAVVACAVMRTASAAQGNAIDALLLLLQLNADVNARDLENQTPLHMAAAGGHAAFVRVLLSGIAGVVDVDARDEEGYSPLHLAALNGHADVLQLLLDSNRVRA